jgi:predicted metal-dependent hydrolase
MAREGVDNVENVDNLDNLESVRAARRRERFTTAGPGEPWSCDETPPDLFYVGLEQFNRGEYFEQHESLEEIWIADGRQVRRLYQGILKVGVGFYKLRLGNYRGTVNHLRGGIAYLELFPDTCLGVEVARLISDARAVLARVEELGPQKIREFDLGTLPRIVYRRE